MKLFKLPILLIATVFFYDVSAQRQTQLHIDLGSSQSDTVIMYITGNSVTRDGRRFRLGLHQGKVDTTISLLQTSHILLVMGNKKLCGYIDPGSTFSIKGDTSDLLSAVPVESRGLFGIATSLVNFRESLFANRSAGLKKLLERSKSSVDPYQFLFAYADSAEASFNDRTSTLASTASKQLLQAAIRAEFLTLDYNIPSYVDHLSNETILAKEDINEVVKKRILRRLSFDDNFYFSDAYAESVYTVLFKEYSSREFVNNSHRLTDKYVFLDSVLPAHLRLPVFTLFLESDLTALNQGEDLQMVRQTVFRGQEQSEYAQYISKRLGSLFLKGTPAPDFSLLDTKGQVVTKRSLAGKVVLMDFWYRGCAPCRALHEKLLPVRDQFRKDTNVVFLTISIDDRANWLTAIKEWKIEGKPVYTGGRRAEHPVIADYKVVAYPTMSLLDANGNIFLATPSDLPQELIAQIMEAKKVSSVTVPHG